jgi:uncharacterized protein
MSNFYIIYDAADYDGMMSGAICKYHLDKIGTVKKMIGYYHGDPTPIIPDDCDVLYMVDTSISDLMGHPGLIWIDHHKSAIEKYDKHGFKIQGWRLEGVAAARLCWSWFNSPHGRPSLGEFINREIKSEPMLVTLIGEYDIWDHHGPSAMHLQLGLKGSYWGENVNTMHECLVEYMNGFDPLFSLLQKGNVIEDYYKRNNKRASDERAYEINFEGLRFVALNQRESSMVFDEYKNRDNVDAFMCYFINGDEIRVSLYGHPDKDFDLSQIAMKYGGGGHKFACGFELPLKKIGLICKGGDFSSPMYRYAEINKDSCGGRTLEEIPTDHTGGNVY